MNAYKRSDDKIFCYGVDVTGSTELSYHQLAMMVGSHILNNNIINIIEDFEPVNGSFDEEIYQWYIIDEAGADFLQRFTEEDVMYSDSADMYVWGITHWGTSWDYVSTGIEIEVND